MPVSISRQTHCSFNLKVLDKMKLFLAICAVLSVAVFATADEAEFGFELFAGEFNPLDIDTQRLTPEQRKCIAEGWKKVVADNPNLKDWFDDIEKTSASLRENAKECKALPKPQQKKCFFKLWQKAKAEWHRLFGNLTEEQKKVLHDLKVIIHECVKKPDESIEEFDIEDGEEFDMLGFDPVTFNNNVLECIRDGLKESLDAHPELNEWFEEFHEFAKKTAESAKKCKALTGDAQATCYKKLYLTARTEFRRIIEKLTEEQKKLILQELVRVARKCIQGN